MRDNVKRHVMSKRLKPKDWLIPLFETVINAIHAVEDARSLDLDAGIVRIRIVREQLLKESEPTQSRRISGFVVEDDGCGFTPENWQSFNFTHSDHKASRGGLGVGRLAWLRAFEFARVRSVFPSEKGHSLREFDFRLTADGVENARVVESVSEARGTTVELVNYRSEFRGRSEQTMERISERLAAQLLSRLGAEGCPEILVYDDDGSDPVIVNNVAQALLVDPDEHSFRLGNHDFNVRSYIIQVRAGHLFHSAYLCAHGWPVISKPIDKAERRIPKLVFRDGEQVALIAYVSGSLFHSTLSDQRDGFALREVPSAPTAQIDIQDGLESDEDDPSISEIMDAVAGCAEHRLSPYVEAANEERNTKLREFVYESAPQFRALLKHAPARICVGLRASEREMYTALSVAQREFEEELAEQGSKLLKGVSSTDDYVALMDTYANFVDKQREVVADDLVRYVIHRRTIVGLLDRYVSKDPANPRLKHDAIGTARERAVHTLFHPMGRSSDDVVGVENNNLWLLDERLSYHRHLRSDLNTAATAESEPKPKAAADGARTESQAEPACSGATPRTTRPDIEAFFEQPHYYCEGEDSDIRGVAILEFKKPELTGLSTNPFDTAFDRVDRLRKGRAKLDGRTKRIGPATRISYFIIADDIEGFSSTAPRYGFVPTLDGQGFYGIHPIYQFEMIVMSYDKLVDDAKKRNRAFFDMLQLRKAHD
jgi:hypothetical protein